jgi:menaquinone-dependent protoporphyrinogen IX oxidase
MRAVIVYESMYGNTRAIAEAIAEGIGPIETTVLPVVAADRSALEGADLIVIGAPTHAFGMSRPQTRAAAADAVRKPGNTLSLERGATGLGVREWLAFPMRPARTAVFDTRVKWSRVGHASRAIDKQLSRHGIPLFERPQSFFVTKDNTLVIGELQRARQWGHELGRHLGDEQAESMAPTRNPASTRPAAGGAEMNRADRI